ncbi:MAG: aminotransferase class I/II-fold pyridoxal phosphate-dependent enzyme [Flavobacteriales bacterium]|nr:aminotransferase class I/II-fold pyridoxal phosphate-dependent enzyme [Flavobacteriales bacterium]
MTKHKSNQKLNTVNEIISKGVSRNVLQLRTEDYTYNGRTVHVRGQELINFGSCSYLGLEMDDRLKQGAIDAIQRYGVQFSSSRSYLSNTLYTEWESLLEEMFDAHVVTSTSVSLGHHAVIPVVVDPGDLIILDQQVHASVQDAVTKMKAQGIDVQIVRHNKLDELEKKIMSLKHQYNRIWYMIDGVYSMYGDFAPMKELVEMLDRHHNFHLYADDAHGMSIAGKNGTGVILSQVDFHPKMILATSLNKAYGAGGGAFFFKDKDLYHKVKNCGGSFIFSGGHQIPVIGAGIASARIHLSEEIYERQRKLKDRLRYCHYLLKEVHDLPVVSNVDSPIVYVGLGLVRVGYNMVQRVINDGCFVNLGVFPAVPETCTGLRFTITLHHTMEDIEKLCNILAYHFPRALEDENRTLSDIYRAFKHVPHFQLKKQEVQPVIQRSKNGFEVIHKQSIDEIDESLWNSLMSNQITMNWAGIRLLERTFSSNDAVENNWDFHYLILKDTTGKAVAATFFTLAMVKDDMLSASGVSNQIEELRKEDNYYLCSKTLVMGSLLTEGNHLYIDRNRTDWTTALTTLLDQIWEIQEQADANAVWLRDFHSDDDELTDFFMDQGFLKVNLPDTNIVYGIQSNPFAKYMESIPAKRRKYLKTGIFKHHDAFKTRIVTEYDKSELDRWYELYSQVKNASFEVNSFAQPIKLFTEMLNDPSFEVIEYTLKTDDGSDKVVGITFSHINEKYYNGILLGFDYNYLKTHDIYKQILYRTRLRAEELNCDRIYLGFTASEVKQKFGAIGIPQISMIQMKDHYNLSVLNLYSESRSIHKRERMLINVR